MNALKTLHPYIITLADDRHYEFSAGIAGAISDSAIRRGIEAPARTPDYILDKMKTGLAVIATDPLHEKWMGFSYLEVWDHKRYVANSGLFVPEEYRGIGIPRDIKAEIFRISRSRYPFARLFSLSTSPSVIKSNIELGFQLVTHQEILSDPWFSEGCNSWLNYAAMMTASETPLPHLAMVYDPAGEAVELALSADRQLPKEEAQLKKIGALR